jgi:ribonuclease J
VGRSLNKYVRAAINVNLCPFVNEIQLASYKNQVEKYLKKVNADRTKYVLVCTGHQAEPGSVLDRITRGQLPFNFNFEDHVIFSSSVIPAPINKENRKILEDKLKKRGVRIFNNVHVSGHAGREDLRDFINMMNAEHIIPAHGEKEKTSPMVELCNELGYKTNKTVHQMTNGAHLHLGK